jgi:hypothetical protein
MNLYLVKPELDGEGEFVMAETMADAIATWIKYESKKQGSEYKHLDEPESIMLVQDYIIGEK